MLDALKKKLGTEGQVTAELERLNAALSASQIEVGELTGKLAEFTSANAALSSQLEQLQAELVELADAKAAMEAQAAAAKLQARKEKLTSILGTAKADTTLEAVKGLDDVAFEAVCNAFSASLSAESASPMFKETGVDAVANVNQDEETFEMKELRKMFPNKK